MLLRSVAPSVVAAAAALAFFGCTPSPSSGARIFSEAASDRLTEENIWDYLKYVSNDPSYQGYVKFSLVLDERGLPSRLILHPASFAFHADHLTTLPEFRGLTPKQIEDIAFHGANRRLLLGSLLLPKRGDEGTLSAPWAFHVELLGHDPLEAPLVAAAFARIAAVEGELVSGLQYLPVGEQRSYVEAHQGDFTQAGIPLVSSGSGAARVCYTSGWGVGRVRLLKSSELEGQMRAGLIGTEDILVLDEVPRELPIVAGVVVARESSPSSHVALMSEMAGAPFVFEKDATSLETWKTLAASGEPVFLASEGSVTSACRLTVRGAPALTAQEAQSLVGLRRPVPLSIPHFDTTPTGLLNLKSLSWRDTPRVGAKAANVAELMHLIPESTVSEGLAIPIAIFEEYLNKATTSDGRSLKASVGEHLAGIASGNAPLGVVLTELEAIRKLIEKSNVPADVATKITSALEAQWARGTRLKFRSSSNVEDHPDFNGAGLYESKGACLGDDSVASGGPSLCDGSEKADPVLKAVRKVWASLYTPKGFLARQFFGVAEENVGMGILVQRSFKGELANGVLISEKDDAWNAAPGAVKVTSTGFPGEDDEVANPPPGKTPETASINGNGAEILVPSTEIPRGRTLLAEPLYRDLHALAEKVHAHYLALSGDTSPATFKLDMEWKVVSVEGRDKVILKQVRRVPRQPARDALRLRGTSVVGEREVELCPIPTENPNALWKIRNSMKIRLSLGLHTLPFSGTGEIPNAIENVEVFNLETRSFEKATPGATMAVEAEPWSGWNEVSESRDVHVSSLLRGTFAGDVVMGWNVAESRFKSRPDFLLRPVSSLLETGRIELARKGEAQKLPYRVVKSGTRCEADAWQGLLPGSLGDDDGYAARREPPRAVVKQFGPDAGKRLSFSLEGRTSLQGFDKTMQMQIDVARLSGILDRELVITEPLAAVYAPAHHNFGWQYAADLYAAQGLSAEEKASLRARGMRYLVFPAATSEEANDGIVGRGNETWLRVVAVSEDGVTQRELGFVLMK